jgi:hypothetical protein
VAVAAAGSSLFTLLLIGCHLLCAVIAPLLLLRGLTHLLSRRARRPLGGALFVAGGAVLVGLFGYANRVEPRDLRIRRARIVSPRLAGLERPLKVVVLADLQTDRVGAFEERVFAAIDREKADLVLSPGDFLQCRDRAAYDRQRARIVRLFAGLRHRPPLGIYAVDGDTDLSTETLAGTAVRVLRDEAHRLPAWSRLRVVGLSRPGSRTPLDEDRIRRARAFPGLTILLGHAPDYALPLIEERLQAPLLCIAGHTHGGQVVVPGFGPPLYLARIPRRYAGGLNRAGEGWLLVSRGVGMERGNAPRIRLFCPPELWVLELRPPAAAEARAGEGGLNGRDGRRSSPAGGRAASRRG